MLCIWRQNVYVKIYKKGYYFSQTDVYNYMFTLNLCPYYYMLFNVVNTATINLININNTYANQSSVKC